MRALAAKHPNSYHIVLFACNKEKGKKIRARFISADDALDDYWVKKGREIEAKIPELDKAIAKYYQTRERRCTLSCVNAKNLYINTLFGVQHVS